MVYYLSLILILWAMIFCIGKFFRYYRIVKEYTGRTQARVIEHPAGQEGAAFTGAPLSRRERAGKTFPVLLEYEIEGKSGHAEIFVPQDMAGQYPVGREIAICYKVSGNGAVHIASSTGAEKKLLYAYALAIAAEFAAFFLIWRSML